MASESWEKKPELVENSRLDFYGTLGRLGKSISPLVSYSLQGFPAWPHRDQWQTIERENSTIIASDGLSDPYEDGRPPIGVEVFVEPARVFPDFDSLTSSWEYEALFQASFLVAAYPDHWSRSEARWGTTNFGYVNAPQPWLTDNNEICMLFTLGSYQIQESFATPIGVVKNLVFLSIYPRELDWLKEDRENRVTQFLNWLKEKKYFHYLIPDRESFV